MRNWHAAYFSNTFPIVSLHLAAQIYEYLLVQQAYI